MGKTMRNRVEMKIDLSTDQQLLVNTTRLNPTIIVFHITTTLTEFNPGSDHRAPTAPSSNIGVGIMVIVVVNSLVQL